MSASHNTPNVVSMTHQAPANAAQLEPKRYSAFLPVLLFGLAVLAVLGWQAWVLGSERESLGTSHASQQQTVDNAGKLRASLDALAADTQRLADAGNPNAALLVTELKKRGITINAQVPASSATPAADPPAGK